MSHNCDDTYSIYEETKRKANKHHRCYACHESISAGDKYFVIGIVFQGQAETVKRCLRCQAIHLHLRGLCPGETWPDEMLCCGEEYKEHWGVEPPKEIQELAFITQKEAQEVLK